MSVPVLICPAPQTGNVEAAFSYSSWLAAQPLQSRPIYSPVPSRVTPYVRFAARFADSFGTVCATESSAIRAICPRRSPLRVRVTDLSQIIGRRVLTGYASGKTLATPRKFSHDSQCVEKITSVDAHHEREYVTASTTVEAHKNLFLGVNEERWMPL